MDLPKNELTTQEVRLSYVNLLTPRANDDGKTQYGVQLIIDKKDTATMNALITAREAARAMGVTEGKKPFKDFSLEKLAAMAISRKDGDDPLNADKPELKGCIAINAYAAEDRPPGIVMPDGRTKVTKGSDLETQIYSGMYGKVHLQLYPYKNKKEGIAVSVLNVMKTRDGDPFGGGKRTAPEEVFGGGSPFDSTPATNGSLI